MLLLFGFSFAFAFFFASGLSACKVVLSFASLILTCFGVVSCWFEMFSCGSSGAVRVNGGAGAAGRFDDAKSVRVGFNGWLCLDIYCVNVWILIALL